MTGDDLTVIIDENRAAKTKAANAIGNLPNLLGRVGAGVSPIGSQVVGSDLFDLRIRANDGFIQHAAYSVVEVDGFFAIRFLLVRSFTSKVHGIIPSSHLSPGPPDDPKG